MTWPSDSCMELHVHSERSDEHTIDASVEVLLQEIHRDKTKFLQRLYAHHVKRPYHARSPKSDYDPNDTAAPIAILAGINE